MQFTDKILVVFEKCSRYTDIISIGLISYVY